MCTLTKVYELNSIDESIALFSSWDKAYAEYCTFVDTPLNKVDFKDDGDFSFFIEEREVR